MVLVFAAYAHNVLRELAISGFSNMSLRHPGSHMWVHFTGGETEIENKRLELDRGKG